MAHIEKIPQEKIISWVQTGINNYMSVDMWTMEMEGSKSVNDCNIGADDKRQIT